MSFISDAADGLFLAQAAAPFLHKLRVPGCTHMADGSDPTDAEVLEVDVLGYKVEVYTPDEGAPDSG